MDPRLVAGWHRTISEWCRAALTIVQSPLVVYGPVGIGKSTAVRAACTDHSLRVLEWDDDSDIAQFTAIARMHGGPGRVCIIDDADIACPTPTFLPTLRGLRISLILIASDLSTHAPVRTIAHARGSLRVRAYPPSPTRLAACLATWYPQVAPATLTEISQRCRGDIRAACFAAWHAAPVLDRTHIIDEVSSLWDKARACLDCTSEPRLPSHLETLDRALAPDRETLQFMLDGHIATCCPDIDAIAEMASVRSQHDHYDSMSEWCALHTRLIHLRHTQINNLSTWTPPNFQHLGGVPKEWLRASQHAKALADRVEACPHYHGGHGWSEVQQHEYCACIKYGTCDEPLVGVPALRKRAVGPVAVPVTKRKRAAPKKVPKAQGTQTKLTAFT